ncbi:hypothetical protein M404DRAFT_91800, partial [Pisolithus tinctorius Marx 270]
YVCVCSKYNFGQPHPVSKATWYRHFTEAETEEEKERLRSSQVRPHAGHGSEKLAHRAAVIQAMAKRRLETIEDGHCKHARTHENVSSFIFHSDLPVPDLGEPATPTGPSALPVPGLDRMAAPANVRHERRTHPIVDLEALAESAVLSPMCQSMKFILALKNASLDDDVAKLSTDALERLRNPPDEVVTINNPGIRFAISTYLALENASQQAYNRVCEAAHVAFEGTPAADSILSFYNVEKLVATYTGVVSIEHDMCHNSCIAYTRPFSHLEACPMCHTSRWKEEQLQGTRRRSKVAAQTFTMIPIGPQLQALYWHKDSAVDMAYLARCTAEVLQQLRETGRIPLIDDIAMGWDYLGAVLNGDIKHNNAVLMLSLDGAQLYDSKESDCWMYIWIIINLPPDKRYRKLHIHPGGFIPGPNKPKNLDSFLFPGIHHLTALQAEGLPIWNA